MADRSPLHSEEQALEASTSYSDDGLSLGEGKDRYSHEDTYSDDYASQVRSLAAFCHESPRISCGTYQVEVASISQTGMLGRNTAFEASLTFTANPFGRSRLSFATSSKLCQGRRSNRSSACSAMLVTVMAVEKTMPCRS